jgi:uncharacterized protein (TIGR04255 family)
MASSNQQAIARKERPADLPDFENPPLFEVVLGVQFSELRHFRTFHAGLLWDSKFRKAGFPKCVEQPPLDPVFETFGVPNEGQTRIQLVQMPGPVVPRLWFISAAGTQLVQVQSNRFLHNWRQTQGDSAYPRYETVREHFFEELVQLEAFLSEEQIGTIEPNQCEVTYVNHLELQEGVPWHHLENIFVFFKSDICRTRQEHGAITEFEDGRFSFRHVIRDAASGNPIGRLHIDAQAARESDGKPIIRLNLTARGAPRSPNLQGVADFLDIGRLAIVDTFTTITTKDMHQLWGRKNVSV